MSEIRLCRCGTEDSADDREEPRGRFAKGDPENRLAFPPNQNGPALSAAPTPLLRTEALSGPIPPLKRAPPEPAVSGPIPLDTRTPREPALTRATRGPAVARSPPRPADTPAHRGPTRTPRVDRRIPGTPNPKPIPLPLAICSNPNTQHAHSNATRRPADESINSGDTNRQ